MSQQCRSSVGKREAVFEMVEVVTTVKDAVAKGYIPILVGRVSTSKQRKALPAQMKFLAQRAKDLGFKKKAIELPIQSSGFKGELASQKAIQEIVDANPNKKYVAVFRDSSRIARDTENALKLRREFSEQGVPLVTGDLPELVGKKPMGNRSTDLLFIVLSGVAETGKESEFKAREEGTADAEQAGLVEGVPRNLYLKEYKRNGISVHRQIIDAQPLRNNGTLSGRGLTDMIGIPKKFNDKQRRKIEEELLLMPEKVRQEYLEVIDAILEAEKIVGRRDRTPASSRTRKQKALHRVTVGYLQFPEKFPRPDTVGNPLISRVNKMEGDGTIADAIANPTKYQPPR
jgi:DNA invertase Pin-like site-specific DNA recombinase